MKKTKVLKFGGSSLENGERIKKVGSIIETASKKHRISVVVSAMKGVTDLLVLCAKGAEKGREVYSENLLLIKELHLDAMHYLLKPDEQQDVQASIQKGVQTDEQPDVQASIQKGVQTDEQQDVQASIQKGVQTDEQPDVPAFREDIFGNMFRELEDILHGVELIRECSPRSLDLIMSFGERLSCTLLTSYLTSRGLQAHIVDAREIIITNNNHGAALVSAISYEKIGKHLTSVLARGIPIITGFIASTEDNVTTTLGRNGSDYTASLVGASIKADSIEIWTDVNGVMSADPRYVKNAFVIPQLCYQEAMELSYFGAEVIHPHTMIPAVESDIPILIKNTLIPEAPGTFIAGKPRVKANNIAPITGIASIDNAALVNVEGGGMIGIPGIAARILSTLAVARVNIIMISQASSEHSICLVFKENEANTVITALESELEMELETKRVSGFEIIKNLVIIAIIGENMQGTPGISGKLFSCLGKEKINVLTIAQGSSERNLSFVISRDDKERALKTIHQAFLE